MDSLGNGSHPLMATRYKVEGEDRSPDGYRDHVFYLGSSLRQAIKAWRAAKKEDMELITAYFTPIKPNVEIVYNLSRVRLRKSNTNPQQ